MTGPTQGNEAPVQSKTFNELVHWEFSRKHAMLENTIHYNSSQQLIAIESNLLPEAIDSSNPFYILAVRVKGR